MTTEWNSRSPWIVEPLFTEKRSMFSDDRGGCGDGWKKWYYGFRYSAHLFRSDAEQLCGRYCCLMRCVYASLISCSFWWLPHCLQREKFQNRDYLEESPPNDYLRTIFLWPGQSFSRSMWDQKPRSHSESELVAQRWPVDHLPHLVTWEVNSCSIKNHVFQTQQRKTFEDNEKTSFHPWSTSHSSFADFDNL